MEANNSEVAVGGTTIEVASLDAVAAAAGTDEGGTPDEEKKEKAPIAAGDIVMVNWVHKTSNSFCPPKGSCLLVTAVGERSMALQIKGTEYTFIKTIRGELSHEEWLLKVKRIGPSLI